MSSEPEFDPHHRLLLYYKGDISALTLFALQHNINKLIQMRNCRIRTLPELRGRPPAEMGCCAGLM